MSNEQKREEESRATSSCTLGNCIVFGGSLPRSRFSFTYGCLIQFLEWRLQGNARFEVFRFEIDQRWGFARAAAGRDALALALEINREK
jgi:hypothetical protein